MPYPSSVDPGSSSIVIPEGGTLSITDNTGAVSAVLQIDPSDNNVQILAGTTGTIKFADNTGATIFATSSHTFLLYPNAVIEAFDGSFNSGNILYASSSGITVLQAHPTLNIVEIADSSGNVVFSTKQSATASAITNGNTITTTGIGESRVAPTGNVTGIILQAGTTPTQEVTVVNESAFTVTFNTTPATSNVAGSAADPAIPAKCCRFFKWNSVTGFWYRAA